MRGLTSSGANISPMRAPRGAGMSVQIMIIGAYLPVKKGLKEEPAKEAPTRTELTSIRQLKSQPIILRFLKKITNLVLYRRFRV